MNNLINKNHSIQKIYNEMVLKYGKNKFEIKETGANNSLLLINIENPIWSYSIIAIENGNYSIQIEAEYPELKTRIIPFEIPYVNDNASLAEVIDALGNFG